MLSILGERTTLCDGVLRREWLRLGGLGAFGLALATLEQAAAAPAETPRDLQESFGQANRCIVLFMLGGPPQHETWDPKPDAPEKIRGEFKPIQTAVPGLSVGELMPRVAKLTDRIAVLRAMSTGDNAHSSSGYWMLTGRPHEPKNTENATPRAPNDDPCLAAAVKRLSRVSQGMPAAVRLPEEIWNTGRIVWPGQTAGWLGPGAEPWYLECDPNSPDFRVPDISLPDEVTSGRFEGRRSLLENFDRERNAAQRSGADQRWASLRRRAFDLLHAPQARQAFNLDQEPDERRDRYGRNRFGQSVLLARRLIESGVRLVQVNWTRWKDDEAVAPAWDTHAKNNQRLKTALMPPMDLAYSALLEDLESRGLLDETLVVWMGEFGRTPKFNRRGGRDHWGNVFSVALAGGGVRGGAVHGASDAHGAWPSSGRVEPQDLTATVLHCLGRHPHTLLHDTLGRPHPASYGKPIAPVLR